MTNPLAVIQTAHDASRYSDSPTRTRYQHPTAAKDWATVRFPTYQRPNFTVYIHVKDHKGKRQLVATHYPTFIDAYCALGAWLES